MVKTFIVQDDLHEMVFKKRDEIKQKYGIHLTIESIVDNILRREILNFDIKQCIKESDKI